MSYLPEPHYPIQGVGNFAQALLQARDEAAHQVCLRLLFSDQADLSLTYQGLIDQASRYTSVLEQAHIQPGEVVIIILPHGKELVCAFWGAILHGAVPSIMPYLTEKLQAENYRRSLQALISITRPAAVITYADFVEHVRIANADGPVRAVLAAEEIEDSTFPGITGDAHPASQLKGLDRTPTSLVLLQHSSGTTGLQKGVALTHQAVFNQLESYSQALQLESSDVIVSWLPLYHDMGLIAGFILPIMLRIPLVLLSPFDWVRAPVRLLHAIHLFRGTLCWLPNFAYNFCAQKIRDRDLEGLDLACVRALVNCSEPIHWKSHALFLQRFAPYGFKAEALTTSYAMAENVFAVTQGGITGAVALDLIDRQAFTKELIAKPVQVNGGLSPDETGGLLRMLSSGIPIAGTRVRILSPDGQDLPDRSVGEIAIQGKCMLAGYYNRPDLSGQAFLDGWYLTGDLGYQVDGELYVSGRKKDLIIAGGKNIYPQDLENLAGEVEGVHPGRSVAFGIFNEDTGTEEVVLVAEIDEESRIISGSPAGVRVSRIEHLTRAIREKVSRGSEVTLKTVYLVERNWLIKTSSGKVAREANKAKYLQENG